jgi:putative membrane protein
MFMGLLLAVVIGTQVALGIAPKGDRMTWVLENAPVWIGLVVLWFTRKRFQLSRLCLVLLAIHSVILAVGGHWTYARVPLGEWVKDALNLSRNHYDRLGHFAQGFIPAILVRELLLRKASLKRGGWLAFLTVSVCLAFSAFYEFIEWWTARATGDAATDFLGTQGDVWDTQWDMFLAFCGACIAVATLSRAHDRSMAKVVERK